MSFLVPIALFGWIPAVLFMFAVIPPRRAVITAVLAAWLFLPMAGYDIPGFPDYTKMNATSVGVLLGCMIFDQARLFSFRMRWFDLPMFVWCFVPFMSSVTTGLGLYDGISVTLNQIFIWGLPYMIGRVYFSDLEGLRELAMGIFIGGLVYVPLCLIEVKLSPQLHNWVYGYHPSPFAMTMRFGGFRPTVFMQHGLMVGMWMTAASLVGIWLWRSGTVREIWGIPMAMLVPIQLITTLLCRSMSGVALLVIGLGTLLATGLIRTRAFIIILIVVGPIYMVLRVSDLWSGEQLTAIAALVSTDRAGSLQMRMNNESMLTERALQKPLFGWGTWGHARVKDESGRDVSTTDGLWVIAVGNHGLVGLISMTTWFLLPLVLLCYYHRPQDWSHPWFAAAGVLAVLVALYLLDCIMNAMVNPVFTMAAGGVTGLQGIRLPFHLATAGGQRPPEMQVRRPLPAG